MISFEIWISYTLACILLVISPGPDNILAIARGLSQGGKAALISALASGTGILFHVLAAALGLTVLLQTSQAAFLIVKLIGAAYLIYLGIKVLRSRALISFQAAQAMSLPKIFMTGFLSAALNPKPGLFVLAFIPQFIDAQAGSVSVQMLILGGWFAALTTAGFALMGLFAGRLASSLQKRPRLIGGLNLGAGLTFVAAGISIAVMKQK